MAQNTKQTSKPVAALAAAKLNDPQASATAKSLAASALAQRSTGKQTGTEMEGLASTVLSSAKYNDDTKALAASVLAQANKDR